MTHINQINETDPSFTVSNSKVSKHKETDAFGNVLSRALDKGEAPEMEHIPANALKEIESVDLNFIKSSDIVSGRTEKLLQMLDAYSTKLEDPNVPLKNIAPVLEEIKVKAGSLLEEAQSLTEDDAGLKKLATQTIVTAQTEYLKFQRGDYLP